MGARNSRHVSGKDCVCVFLYECVYVCLCAGKQLGDTERSAGGRAPAASWCRARYLCNFALWSSIRLCPLVLPLLSHLVIVFPSVFLSPAVCLCHLPYIILLFPLAFPLFLASFFHLSLSRKGSVALARVCLPVGPSLFLLNFPIFPSIVSCVFLLLITFLCFLGSFVSLCLSLVCFLFSLSLSLSLSPSFGCPLFTFRGLHFDLSSHVALALFPCSLTPSLPASSAFCFSSALFVSLPLPLLFPLPSSPGLRGFFCLSPSSPRSLAHFRDALPSVWVNLLQSGSRRVSSRRFCFQRSHLVRCVSMGAVAAVWLVAVLL